jgi:protein-tyrosine-phosphatase
MLINIHIPIEATFVNVIGPYIPGKRYIDWDLQDPKGRPIEEVRATRDEIARRVAALLTELDAVKE